MAIVGLSPRVQPNGVAIVASGAGSSKAQREGKVKVSASQKEQKMKRAEEIKR